MKNVSASNDLQENGTRCVIVGGAPIRDYERVRAYLKEGDYLIYCDSGLCHMEGLDREPSLIVADFDSHEDPHMDVETIVLPVAKDDTDTVYAVREALARGYRDFLLIGVFGARLDHTLVNAYVLFDLDARGCTAIAVDDYSEFEVLSAGTDAEGRCVPGTAYVEERFPYFSLINMTGVARGVTIQGAKFGLQDSEITSEYQYATSNEVIPGQTAEITIREGKLLLIRDTI